MFAAVAIPTLAVIARRASGKPFWHDEIYTILLSRLPSLADIWRATREGIDLSPPLTTVLTRIVHDAVGAGHIATRLPAMAGYALMIACIFAFVRPRAGSAAAISAALMPFFSATQRYAIEARGYGLMIGFGALAFWSWTEAASTRRGVRHLIALALGVGASVWAHYYAVLLVAAIALGELVRAIVRRQIDWGIIAALGVGALGTLPLLPLIQGAAGQRDTFWADVPGSEAIAASYTFLFGTFGERLFAIAIAAIAMIAIAQRFAMRDRSQRALYERIGVHEIAALAMLVLLPVGGYLLGIAITGVFVPRYLLATTIGVTIAVSVSIARLGAPLASLATGAFLAALTAITLVTTFRSPISSPNPFLARPLLVNVLRSPGPTVVQGNIHFLQLWYYAPPELKVRMRYLVDREEALERLGNDTIDRGYAGLARCCALTAHGRAEFMRRYREFNLYVVGSNWLVDKLREDGVGLEERGREPGAVLLRVRQQ